MGNPTNRPSDTCKSNWLVEQSQLDTYETSQEDKICGLLSNFFSHFRCLHKADEIHIVTEDIAHYFKQMIGAWIGNIMHIRSKAWKLFALAVAP